MLAAIDHHAGLQMSWLLKPLVDLAAAVAGFLVSRLFKGGSDEA